MPEGTRSCATLLAVFGKLTIVLAGTVLAGVALGCSEPTVLVECRAVAGVMNPELSHIASEYGDGSRVEAAGWRSLAERYERLGRELGKVKVAERALVQGRRDLQTNFAQVAAVLRRVGLAKERNEPSSVAQAMEELAPLQRRHSAILQNLTRACQIR